MGWEGSSSRIRNGDVYYLLFHSHCETNLFRYISLLTVSARVLQLATPCLGSLSVLHMQPCRIAGQLGVGPRVRWGVGERITEAQLVTTLTFDNTSFYIWFIHKLLIGLQARD